VDGYVIVRPTARDQWLVAYFTAKVITGVGLLMTVPLVTSVAFGEWNTAADFGISLLLALTVGLLGQTVAYTPGELKKRHAFIVVSTSWIAATLFGAVPFALSGHFGSLLDCFFDVMSGFTTTGLYLLQDLDHIAQGLNMWRFLLTFAGGQGIVVLALTFLFRGVPGTFQLYAGEGKEERLVPHVIGTARIIWLISLVWLVVGTIVMSAVLLFLGEGAVRSVLHGLWIFMGAFSTGGFAPQSYNTAWFHSLLFEVVTIIVFFAGSLNFAVHWAAWTGNPRELLRNIETRAFALTLTLLVVIGAYGLAQAGVYGDTLSLFRKVFYLMISGHTTTGFATIYSRTLVVQWGPIAMLAIIATMILGGSSCSTAGGIKGIRVGIITKSFLRNIREMVAPDSAVLTARYHHVRDTMLTDPIAQNAMTITLAFLAMHALVTLIGVMYGYPLVEAAFEGISAGSNTGLSCGVVAPTMPWVMKLALLISMWLGRMEFLSVFALVGWVWATVRGR
jgi:trk system potassium uptake protein TrkH